MKPVYVVLAPVFCSLFFLILTGCSKSDAPKAASSPSTSKSSTSLEPAPPFVREKLKNLADYRMIDVLTKPNNEKDSKALGKPLLAAYWSASKESPEWAASDLFDEVFAERDTFRRKDLAKNRQAEAEAFIAESRKFSPLAFQLPAPKGIVNIGPYDEKEKGYRVYISDEATYVLGIIRKGDSFNMYPSFFCTNKGNIYYKPKDEAEARKVEAALSLDRSGDRTVVPVIVYGRVVGTHRDGRQLSFYVAVDGIAIQAPKTGETLFTLGLDQLGSAIWTDKDTLRKINGS
jgi:hypothetical protein